MCFVWISEQTAIISLYSINWLVCITETECVYCAVRTGSLYIIQYRQFNIQQFYVLPHTAVFMCFVWISEQTAIISLYSNDWLVCITETVFTARYGLDLSIKIRLIKSLIVHVVSCRRLTAAVRFRSKVSPCEICDGQSGTWTGLLPALQISPVNTIPSMFHSHLHLHVAPTRRANGRSLGAFQKAMPFGNRGALDRKEIPVLLVCNGLGSTKRSVHRASSGTSLAVRQTDARHKHQRHFHFRHLHWTAQHEPRVSHFLTSCTEIWFVRSVPKILQISIFSNNSLAVLISKTENKLACSRHSFLDDDPKPVYQSAADFPLRVFSHRTAFWCASARFIRLRLLLTQFDSAFSSVIWTLLSLPVTIKEGICK